MLWDSHSPSVWRGVESWLGKSFEKEEDVSGFSLAVEAMGQPAFWGGEGTEELKWDVRES